MPTHNLFPSILPGAKKARADRDRQAETDEADESDDYFSYQPEEGGEDEETDDEEEPAIKRGELETYEEVFDRGDCPWCEDYDGENPKQHASAAHPERYRAWKNPDVDGDAEEQDG